MRYLLYLPGIILLLIPFVGQMLADKQAAEAQREREAAAEAQRITAEKKKAERERAQVVKREIAAQRRAEREAAQAAAHAVKLARAAELAELAERRLRAEREAAALRGQAAQAAPVEAAGEPTQAAQAAPVEGDGEPTEAAQAAPVEADREPTEADREPTEADREPTEADREPTEADGMSLDAFAELVTPRPFAGHTVAFTGRVYSRKGEHVPRADLVELVRDLGGRAYDKGMPAGTTLLVVGEKPGMKKMDQADEWIGQVKKITTTQFWNMIQTA